MKRTNYTREAVLAKLRRKELGAGATDGFMPTQAEWNKFRETDKSYPVSDWINRHMGTWDSVAKDAGLIKRESWSRDQVKAAIIEMSHDNYLVTRERWESDRPKGAPSRATVEKLFGCTWSELANELGLRSRSRNPVKVVKMPQLVKRKPTPRAEPTFVNASFFADSFLPPCETYKGYKYG